LVGQFRAGQRRLRKRSPCAVKTLFSILCAAFLILPGAASLRAQPVAELIQQAYVLDVKLKAAPALALYQRAEKLQPRNVVILVGIARQYRHLMADETDNEEKLRLGRLALDHSIRAAALAPNDSVAQLDVAITLGKMLSLEGRKEQVESSRRIKIAVDKSLKLDSKNDLAWFVLGRWHQTYAELSGVRRKLGEMLYGKLPESTYADAAHCFEKAIASNPHRLIHYIELGRCYAQMGRTAEARKLIEKGLAMPGAEKDDPNVKERGRETLAGLE
jgi:tetratricopeptide (TPR) repeat protein